MGVFAFRCGRDEVDAITPELSRQQPGKVGLWLRRVFVVCRDVGFGPSATDPDMLEATNDMETSVARTLSTIKGTTATSSDAWGRRKFSCGTLRTPTLPQCVGVA